MAEATTASKKCKIKKCKRPYRAKGYCSVHYKAWRLGELPKGRYKICTKEDCLKPRFKGSLCEDHHNEKYGIKKEEPAAPVAAATPAAEKPAEKPAEA